MSPLKTTGKQTPYNLENLRIRRSDKAWSPHRSIMCLLDREDNDNLFLHVFNERPMGHTFSGKRRSLGSSGED